MIAYLTADLIWATRIKGVADDLGIRSRPVRTVEMLEARLADDPPSSLLLDLDAEGRAFDVLARVRGEHAGDLERSIRVVAFGPHVRKDLFQQARDGGADEVLTRGALEHNLPEILLALAGRAGSRGDS